MKMKFWIDYCHRNLGIVFKTKLNSWIENWFDKNQENQKLNHKNH